MLEVRQVASLHAGSHAHLQMRRPGGHRLKDRMWSEDGNLKANKGLATYRYTERVGKQVHPWCTTETGSMRYRAAYLDDPKDQQPIITANNARNLPASATPNRKRTARAAPKVLTKPQAMDRIPKDIVYSGIALPGPSHFVNRLAGISKTM